MADLTIITIDPHDTATSVGIDTKVLIEFSEPVYSPSINYGINIFTERPAQWYGNQASIMDTANSDVFNIGQQTEIINGTFTLDEYGTIVTFTPSSSLKPDTTYTIQVLPGIDPERYITKNLFSTFSYTYTSNTQQILTLTRPYKGLADIDIELTFGYDSQALPPIYTIDAIVNGTRYYSIDYIKGEEFNIEGVYLTASDYFAVGDTVTFNAYAPEGLTSVVQTSFTTSYYETATVESKKLDDELYRINYSEIRILETTPKDLTINNVRCNPLTVKFNKILDPIQDLTDNISAVKYDMITGNAYKLNTQGKISSDTIKLYFTGIDMTYSLDGLEDINTRKEKNLLY